MKESTRLKVKSDYIIYCDESCPLEYEPITLLGAIGCGYEKKDKSFKKQIFYKFKI